MKTPLLHHTESLLLPHEYEESDNTSSLLDHSDYDNNEEVITKDLYAKPKAAGCDEEDDDDSTCSKKIHGLIKPSSLLTIGATTIGIIACFVTPIMGAIADFTNHRKSLGMYSAIFLTAAQAILIGTTSKTWEIMFGLLILSSFVLQIQILASFSYLPEIAAKVNNDKSMATFMSKFTMYQFFSQIVFILVVTCFSFSLNLDDVQVAHVSQGLDTILITIGFTAWYYLPSVPARHTLPSNSNIICAGFYQNYKTLQGIRRYYSETLGWFLIANMFGAAGTDAFITVAITYVTEVLELSSEEVGVVFFLALLFSIAGAKLGATFSKRYDPITSLKILLIVFAFVTIIGPIVLSGPERKHLTYLFGVFWGICLGWHFPTSNLIFSLAIPKGQESELTGFFLYSSQVVNWLPTLVFTLMNEWGVSMRFGVMSLSIFYFTSLFFTFQIAPWDDVRHQAKQKSKMIVYENDNTVDTDPDT